MARLRGRTPQYLIRYAAVRLFHRVDAASILFPALERDLADSVSIRPTAMPRRAAGARPQVAWVVQPPSAGSGGHTTLFRMAAAAARAGCDVTVLLYDLHGGDMDRHAAVIRRHWPWLPAQIKPVPEEISGFDAVVASNWASAHVIATRAVEGRRLYFIQDYEPFFYPRGSEYAFAEDSYRFGFRNLALGRMVHEVLRDELGVDSDLVPFGLDAQTYRLEPTGRPRDGVVWYARRGSDRRGYRHAVRALELFNARHPDVPIHVYGDVISGLPFPVVNHGSVRPSDLNTLYNGVVAGLTLSFTNVSLVPEEMLAAGVIPVVNEDRYARIVLDNPHVVWAQATPGALANALSEVVTAAHRADRAIAAAGSVTGRSWHEAEGAVARILTEEVGTVVGAPD
ncbi:glycosyltransferase family 1 protein [Xylanimonas ulmi]|uniref:Glycosyltransferase involved in cell wall biosynthesis n=1 Tax=Xylanimonas ulmi TaxID=228973 RepID=A0A4Q7M4C5_9MICO|nr:glycosyltransferase family 1 protein [Xylanibacterium ulmi]RZS61863.1 hypothetical protein EV386_2175 [Xylanibacterium ulmi]